MNTVINPHLLRHRETKSAAFNNLCTIIHKLTDEGVYAGEIVQGKRVLGNFRLTYDRNNETSQVNIDLSAFDALFRANVPTLSATTDYAVGKDGYIVFHASGHHDGLYVKLTKLPKAKGTANFDSRKLGKGDLVAFRLFQPGHYTITNEPGGQKATLTVRSAENNRYPDLTKMEPVRVTLADKGFDPSRIEKWPVQALLISTETAAALTLQSAEPTPAKSVDRKPAPPRAKKKSKRA